MMREHIQGAPPASGEILTAVEAANRVNGAAQRALSSRQWLPGPVEQRVARDLGQAAARPPLPLPAETGFRRELDMLAAWAPLIRLAMSAGGWDLPVATAAPPGPGTGMSLPVLLAAVYRPAQFLRRWQAEAPWPAGDREADAALENRFPGAAGCLRAADQLIWGLAGSVTVTLHVASGDGDPGL